MRQRLKLFLSGEYIAFGLLFIYLYRGQKNLIELQELVFFILLLFILANISAFVNYINEITTAISLPVLIPALVVLGPFWSAVVALVSTIVIKKVKEKFIWYKFIFNRAMIFLAVGCGGLVFELSKQYFSAPYFAFSLLLASIVYFVINGGLVSAAVLLEGTSNDFSVILYFAELIKNLLISYLLGMLFYFIYANLGSGFLVLGIIFIYLIKEFVYTRLNQLNYYTQIIESFLKVIDSKDNYTEGHCKRVAKYVEVLCKALKLGPTQSNQIIQMAKIHDIGKIKVDDQILKCSGKLTKEQYERIKQHTVYGQELLRDIELLNNDLETILYHHERYDGSGYPKGLAKKEIPLGARLLAVCDAFDVMTRGRVYKAAMDKEEVVQELHDCAGTQFDPKIANKMIELIKGGEFDKLFAEGFGGYKQQTV